MIALLCSLHPPPLSFPRTTPQSQTSPRTVIPKKPKRPRWSKLQASPKGFSTASKEPSRSSKKPGMEPEDPPIPQEVFERMMVRIVASVGAPMAIGLAILKLLGMLKDNNVWDVPLWVPFFTTLATFGASALGIAYGSLSTSLDPSKKGSLLGFEEAQENWVEMWKDEDRK